MKKRIPGVAVLAVGGALALWIVWELSRRSSETPPDFTPPIAPGYATL